MSYQCPECQKVLKTKKSLQRHMESQHRSPKEPAGKEGIKVLEIKAPAAKKPASDKSEVESQAYHCQDCGAELKKGQTTCPGCDEPLVWEGIE